MSHKCFYCGVHLKRRGTPRFSNTRKWMHPDSLTTDHIVPQSKIEAAGHPSHDPRWNALNRVHTCFSCNNRKGDMWPLDWLQIIPSPEGAERLGHRLAELGCEQAVIDAVMKLRPASTVR